MVSRRLLVGAIVVVVGIMIVVVTAWGLGWIRSSGPTPPVSPVSARFACGRPQGQSDWFATATNVTSKESHASFEVTLTEGTNHAVVVHRTAVHKFYIGGTGQASLFFNDLDSDLTLSTGDAFEIGTQGSGPYQLTLFWHANGATIATVDCM